MIEQSYSIVIELETSWRYFSISSVRGLVLSPIGAWGVLYADPFRTIGPSRHPARTSRAEKA